MGRGKTAEVGDTRIAANGYHYTKTETRGWVLTHWLTAEKMLGREIRSDEQVRFKTKQAKTILMTLMEFLSLRSAYHLYESEKLY